MLSSKFSPFFSISFLNTKTNLIIDLFVQTIDCNRFKKTTMDYSVIEFCAIYEKIELMDLFASGRMTQKNKSKKHVILSYNWMNMVIKLL